MNSFVYVCANINFQWSEIIVLRIRDRKRKCMFQKTVAIVNVVKLNYLLNNGIINEMKKRVLAMNCLSLDRPIFSAFQT